jgi:hypothetical protein
MSFGPKRDRSNDAADFAAVLSRLYSAGVVGYNINKANFRSTPRWDLKASSRSKSMTDEAIENLGPLAVLAGAWEGEKGGDTAPSPERSTAHRKFRERMTFDPIGRVDNHEQMLYGLRYATTAWPEDSEDPFHEEVGYWLWDAGRQQVMRCFIVPRGVTVLAGGTVAPDATNFRLAAEVGSETYGICSNLFLDDEFKTIRYEFEVTIHDPDRFSYAENTVLQIKGQRECFDHKDENTLVRVA